MNPCLRESFAVLEPESWQVTARPMACPRRKPTPTPVRSPRHSSGPFEKLGTCLGMAPEPPPRGLPAQRNSNVQRSPRHSTVRVTRVGPRVGMEPWRTLSRFSSRGKMRVPPHGNGVCGKKGRGGPPFYFTPVALYNGKRYVSRSDTIGGVHGPIREAEFCPGHASGTQSTS